MFPLPMASLPFSLDGMALKTVDVVGVGLNATDTVITLPSFPALGAKQELQSSQILLGGQVASAMIACQAWGLRARYVGSVGDDAAAELQRGALAHAGVETHLNVVSNCASQIALILVDGESGERTILWKRDARLALRAEHLRREWITSARALLVDGHDVEAAACAARWAREAGVPVAADVDNLYPGVESLLEKVDYLIASQEFPARLTGEPDLKRALPDIARRFRCRVAGATLGRGGVLAWDGIRFHYAPAFRVQTVDTTGAGDIFHGAFVFGLVKQWPLPRILEFSCAAAGLNCTALGARGGIRPLDEIERLTQEGARHDPIT
jgi:sulfofructose kinase